MEAPQTRIPLGWWIVALVFGGMAVAFLTGSCTVQVGVFNFSLQFIPWVIALFLVVQPAAKILPAGWLRAIPYLAHAVVLAVSISADIYSALYLNPLMGPYQPSTTFNDILIGFGVAALVGVVVAAALLLRLGKPWFAVALFVCEGVVIVIVFFVSRELLATTSNWSHFNLGPSPP